MLKRIRVGLKMNPAGQFATHATLLARAAVCVIMKRDSASDRLFVLLVKRKISVTDPWSGQMAFPGGRSKEGDGELINTAMREVGEETGINVEECELLGMLDDSHPGNRSVCVTPYVVLAPESMKVTIDKNEITDHIWIPLDFFIDRSNSRTITVKRFGIDDEVESFVYQDTYVVWGMTLRFISDFLSKTALSSMC